MSPIGTESKASLSITPTSRRLPNTGVIARRAILVRFDSARQNTFRALRHRDYRLYFFGQLVSVIGSWMQTTALTWLAYELTSKSTWAAVITAAQLLPVFFLAPWGGILADRLPKRWLIFSTQTVYMVLALLLAGLVFAGVAGPWTLLWISLGSGLVTALDLPARLAFVNDMAGREDLMNAVALNSLLFNVARLLGPVMAGFLLQFSSPGMCFLANGVSFLAVLWALASMDVEGQARSAPGRTRRRTLVQVLEGFRYLAPRPGLICLVLAATVLCLVAWPMTVLLPAFSTDVLGQKADGYSVLLSAMGLGALVSALTVATFGSLARRRGFLAGGVTVLMASLVGLSLAHSLAWASLCCALTGFGLIMFFVTGQSVLQLSADDSNRGRVMAVWAMVQNGALPLGSWLAGAAADAWGVPDVLRIGGIGCATGVLLILALLWWLSRATHRRLAGISGR